MTFTLKLALVLLCGYIFAGTLQQIATDFANVRAHNQERIERAINECR